MNEKTIILHDGDKLLTQLTAEVKNVKEELLKLKPLLKKKEDDTYITVEELCQTRKCCRATVFRMVRKGVLTAYKFGAKTLFKNSEVNNALIKKESYDF